MNKQKLLPLTLIFFLSGSILISDAYAYLDPGSGSIILQALIGVLVGVAITLKLYWFKFKEKFLRLTKKSD
jgi:hypothetical protein